MLECVPGQASNNHSQHTCSPPIALPEERWAHSDFHDEASHCFCRPICHRAQQPDGVSRAPAPAAALVCHPAGRRRLFLVFSQRQATSCNAFQRRRTRALDRPVCRRENRPGGATDVQPGHGRCWSRAHGTSPHPPCRKTMGCDANMATRPGLGISSTPKSSLPIAKCRISTGPSTVSRKTTAALSSSATPKPSRPLVRRHITSGEGPGLLRMYSLTCSRIGSVPRM